MSALATDTLRLARKLREKAGFTPESAEALAEHPPTRQDILRLEDHRKIQADRLELRIETVKADTPRRLFGALAAQTAMIVALDKLAH